MKKYELIAAIASDTGLTQVDVTKMVDSMQSIILKECVDNGGEVNLPQLGKFKQKINPARKGINPLTKKPMDVPESHTLRFSVSSSVKTIVKKTAKKSKK